MGLLSGELIRYFAETPLLDIISVTAYYEALSGYLDQLEATRGQLMADNGIQLSK